MSSVQFSCSVMSNSLQLHGLNSLGQNTGVCSLSLLQGIFPTQGSNPGLPHCRQILYQLSHKGRYEAVDIISQLITGLLGNWLLMKMFTIPKLRGNIL